MVRVGQDGPTLVLSGVPIGGGGGGSRGGERAKWTRWASPF